MRNQAFLFVLLACALSGPQLAGQDPEQILLNDYDPRNIHVVPRTPIGAAAFPIIDMHSHPYASDDAGIRAWIRTMKKKNVDKTVLLTYAVGERFDELVELYGKYPDHFELWCGIDFAGYDEPGWSEKAAAELERCHRLGARGVGEIHDKGLGLRSGTIRTQGLRVDDPRMAPVLRKLADLNMPINIHIAEPMWMYEPMDVHNDGLMNAYKWRIDLDAPGLHDHGELIEGFERAVAAHPNTTFIASHLLNCSHDLSILGALFDKYPNLYADNSARYAETATIPRHVRAFYEKYADRIVYGTDMGMSENMYDLTLRIMETLDEHFYANFSYHWPLYGLGLSRETLEQVYRENARRLLPDRP